MPDLAHSSLPSCAQSYDDRNFSVDCVKTFLQSLHSLEPSAFFSSALTGSTAAAPRAPTTGLSSSASRVNISNCPGDTFDIEDATAKSCKRTWKGSGWTSRRRSHKRIRARRGDSGRTPDLRRPGGPSPGGGRFSASCCSRLTPTSCRYQPYVFLLPLTSCSRCSRAGDDRLPPCRCGEASGAAFGCSRPTKSGPRRTTTSGRRRQSSRRPRDE